MEAIEGNYAEVEMGKLAQSNGQSDSVKSFGQILVNDTEPRTKKQLRRPNPCRKCAIRTEQETTG